MRKRPDAHWLKSLGPGLLFAAAAVGVSHLVQSTRAGAGYGLALVGVVIAANVIKYPAFRFGPHYAAATGMSLLEGYRRRGRWALLLYGMLTLATMFTIQAGVTVVTAGLAIATFKLPVGPVVTSGLLIAACGLMLAAGHYRVLDRVTKVLVAVLTVSTLAATILVLPRVDWSSLAIVPLSIEWNATTIVFVAALIGWMPSAIDVSVWHSLWTLARGQDTQHRPTLKEATLDFHIGYVGTAALALCFVLMGAGVLFGSNVPIPDQAGAFASLVIRLYTETLGSWAGPIVSVSAFAVMLSTTLTVLDGFPRALSTFEARLRRPEDPAVFELDEARGRRVYWASLVVLGLVAVLVLALFLQSLKAMIDVATTLSFLTAPLLSLLNHRAVLGDEVPASSRPRLWLVAMSVVCIVLQSVFAIGYLWIRYHGDSST
ncbi:MAG: divalent metal cation transporter [Deltaproteobacteria bacterium]|nr:divalent metal cation transporter [Deltaproteobacteria bacterium]